MKKNIKKIKEKWPLPQERRKGQMDIDKEDKWKERINEFVTNYDQYREANDVLENNCRNNNSISNKDNKTRKKNKTNKKHYINKSQSMDSKLDDIILRVINGYEAKKKEIIYHLIEV